MHHGSAETHNLIKKSTFSIFNNKKKWKSKIDSFPLYYLHVQNPGQPSNPRGVDLTTFFFFLVVGSGDEKGRLKWYMSNISNLLRGHCPRPLTPCRWQSQLRRNGIKMIACWQEPTDPGFHPCRQRERHHLFSKWHINEFSNTWTFLAWLTFATGGLHSCQE